MPVTPRHRVPLAGSRLLLTPRTPRTPSTPTGNIPTVYNSARQLFARSAHPGPLVGRDDERAELRTFLRGCIDARSGGCLYVSGPPGTGKSALVGEICDETKARETEVKMAHVNCMSIHTAKDMFGKLVDDLCPDVAELEADAATTLHKMFMPKVFMPRRKKKQQQQQQQQQRGRSVYVVVLDEIDHLLTLELEVVYRMFEWSLQPASQLVLVGIANALDFTDRFLPRLKARNLTPQLLPFLPYGAAQINSVITNRLRSLLPAGSSAPPDFVPFIHPSATQLCARKVASQTGDIRKAFDICRKAIDLIESETRQKHQEEAAAVVVATSDDFSPSTPSRVPLVNNINLASSPSVQASPAQPTPTAATATAANTHLRRAMADSLRALTPEKAPRATIAHVAKISSASFGHGVSQRLQSLNLHQRAALCALVAIERKKRRACSTRESLLATPTKFTTTTGKGAFAPSRSSSASSSTSLSSSLDRGSPTIRALLSTYAKLCRRDGLLQPLSNTEFRDVITSLETLSLVMPIDRGTSTSTSSSSSSLFTSSSANNACSSRGAGGPRRGRPPVTGGLFHSAVASTASPRARVGGGFRGGVGVGSQASDDRRVASNVNEKDLLDSLEQAGGAQAGLLRGFLVEEDDDDVEMML